ncbi:uncharacterized protein LOC119388358 [Rhipicephalus sanguineus]|uniref:uncharacterized protein LOC119388358 n=1 Tax=Rhipicephalus sanguineus TaxID=34632 RepID=UPI00189594F0|nr:uncharacterized protein LOC119388358 [Rhipicephalus sanguineus]
MTQNDLTLLKSKLELVPPSQLHSLDDYAIPSLTDLQNMEGSHAVSEIIRTLNDMTTERRLHCVAWLYCWLMSRISIQPWFAVRFRKASVIVRFDEWLSRMATLMQHDGFHVTMESDINDGTIFACFLVRDLAGQSHDHLESFVVMWPGLPLVMMHAMEPRLMNSLLGALSESVDRAPMLRLDAPPGNLQAVFHSCLLKLGIQLTEGTLEVPSVVMATELPGPPNDEEAMQRCIGEWNAAIAALGDRLQPWVDRRAGNLRAN